MQKEKIIVIPVFSSLEEEVDYLRKKVAFLEAHGVLLANTDRFDEEIMKNIQLKKQLIDMENSRSWRITRPLRQLSLFLQKSKARILFKLR